MRSLQATRGALRVYFGVAFFLILCSASTASSKPLSSRVADYSIDVRLNPKTHLIDGHEVLVWHNTSSRSAGSLYFHLYPNAFKSDNTTYMTEMGGNIPPRARGWIDILNFTYLKTNENMTDLIRYVRPDDGNPQDSTVMMVQLTKPVRPGDSATVSIDFQEQVPEAIYRGGWAASGQFYLVSQWFPKIGVFQNGEWNCHQYHAFTGFFADFGAYNVKITVPSGYTVGATGVRTGGIAVSNGSITYHYIADDVHGFAWTASSHIVRMTRDFKYPGLPETKIRLLLQPYHRDQAGRYFAAVDSAMKYFGLWYGPFPYPVLTVVDPPPGVHATGMSMAGGLSFGEAFPMLIAAAASDYTLGRSLALESVILREFGHEYWHDIVAGNDFEEAWLDDGLDLYSSEEILKKTYGSKAAVFKVGDVYPMYMYPLVVFQGVPVAAIVGKVRIQRPYNALPRYLRYAKTDAVSQYGYKALSHGAYRTIAYDKPELVLCTLEGILGREMMKNILRTYFERYKFGHPTADDFENMCQKISGRDLSWFFTDFINGTGTVDFAVKSISYYRETDLGTGASSYVSRVTVIRNGEIRMPVELRLSLDDGTSVDTVWNGLNRWKSFTFRTAAPPDYAVLDPSGKIPIDTDFANNSLRVHSFLMPVIKWAARILGYFQNMLLNVGMLS